MLLETGFPDAELVVMALLDPVGLTVTATDSLTTPVIRINRVGGTDDRITDFPNVEVMCFAPDRATTSGGDQPSIPGRGLAWQMSEQCRQRILASVRTTVDYQDPDGNTVTALVDNARTITPAQQVPYGDKAVRTVSATYRLSMRRPTITAP